METGTAGQVNRSAAEVYEEFFVPALFAEWAPVVADAARLEPGQRVLDVACGTGVLAREAARRVMPGGAVVGLDRNEGMLAVAARKAPEVEWRPGQAESLPFGDGEFDAVVSQFGLMFFSDQPAALREMWRVLRPGGRIAVAVWDTLERTPGYADMTVTLERLFGRRVADELRAPYALGEAGIVRSLFERAGVDNVEIRTRSGSAHYPSMESWVHVDVKGWTLADLIDDAQYETLLRAAEHDLRRHVQGDGSVRFEAPAHIVTAQK